MNFYHQKLMGMGNLIRDIMAWPKEHWAGSQKAEKFKVVDHLLYVLLDGQTGTILINNSKQQKAKGKISKEKVYQIEVT